MEPEAIDRLLGLGLFQQPVPLGMSANRRHWSPGSSS
jgi:hypothetical protein